MRGSRRTDDTSWLSSSLSAVTAMTISCWEVERCPYESFPLTLSEQFEVLVGRDDAFTGGPSVVLIKCIVVCFISLGAPGGRRNSFKIDWWLNEFNLGWSIEENSVSADNPVLPSRNIKCSWGGNKSQTNKWVGMNQLLGFLLRQSVYPNTLEDLLW